MQLTNTIKQPQKEPVWAIGLMSGTSLDGVDAALLRTDGVEIAEFGASYALEYTDEFRSTLRGLLVGEGDEAVVEKELTLLHTEAVNALLDKAGMQPDQVAVIGFHGQTIWHRPEQGKTHQIGDAALLVRETGINVVSDFRSNDMQHGGQGAPLVPVFHQALMQGQPGPVAVLNIGGVANVTWIGEQEGELIAFDTGPGNALINDWVSEHHGQPYDEGGKLAAAGKVDEALLAKWLAHDYFTQPPPKSLDRNTFNNLCFSITEHKKITPPACGGGRGGELPSDGPIDGSVSESVPPPPNVNEREALRKRGGDVLVPSQEGEIAFRGVTTITEFTARSIASAQQHFPAAPKVWYVAGGGVHNGYLMQRIENALGAPIKPITALGLNPDMLEAQAFAFLATRSIQGLPLTFPGTTGVREAVGGGVLCGR